MGKRILSDGAIDEMAELRERGWSIAKIARHFTRQGTPVSHGCIAWQCLRVGADLPVERRVRPYARLITVVRGGRPVRSFTDQEDRTLLAMEAAGATRAEMARALERGNNSVRGRLYTLARRDARAEEAALG